MTSSGQGAEQREHHHRRSDALRQRRRRDPHRHRQRRQPDDADFSLPQGSRSPARSSGRTSGTSGFKYKDGKGEQGPVRTVIIRRTRAASSPSRWSSAARTGRSTSFRPIPERTASSRSRSRGGDRYCIQFADGQVTERGSASLLKVRSSDHRRRCTSSPSGAFLDCPSIATPSGAVRGRSRSPRRIASGGFVASGRRHATDGKAHRARDSCCSRWWWRREDSSVAPPGTWRATSSRFSTFADDLRRGSVFHDPGTLATLAAGVPRGTTADAYYQTYLWRDGRLWSRYPPGFPLLLAGAGALAGERAMHLLNPLLYLVLVGGHRAAHRASCCAAGDRRCGAARRRHGRCW